MNNINVKKSKEFLLNSFQNKKYQLYYYLSASLILILIFIIFIIYPLINVIFQELNSVNIINSQNNQMQQRYNDITSSYYLYNKNIRPNINYLNKSLPNVKDTAFIFGNLYQIMHKSNIDLTNINFNVSGGSTLPPQVNALSKNFDVAISAIGSYQELISFLDSISNYPQRILIYNISFVPNLTSNEQAVPTGSMFTSTGAITFDALIFYSN